MKKPPKKQSIPLTAPAIMARLKSLYNPRNIAGQARYGIRPKHGLGIAMPVLEEIARAVGKNEDVALELWASGIHEAQILAGLILPVSSATPERMDDWAAEFDTWGLCDQVCSKLFDKTPHARRKALSWSRDPREYVRRAGYVIMAALAVHDKKAPDLTFDPFLKRIEAGSNDERNFVKKAVNWALRQIGKRNAALQQKAIALCDRLLEKVSRSARWIASDARRELLSEQVLKKLKDQPPRSAIRKKR